MVFKISFFVDGTRTSALLGMYREGSLQRTSNLDSPNMPPIGMPGLDAVKKKKERARNDSQAK